ncbi:MarR family transcriptional regulator [Mycolicibacterium fluoranthenivorans]|uniref:MarR family transcriptional regulator n=1 Tax=Mycolicibacterium fluoranthenivorans TaxID=258505 RepID=A0A7G8PIW0_9MYCO|nr:MULTISPECIES: MarR family transcriptional regulator [Mycobacteriaceae]MCV7252655.1 MarR family transcriptional regulator [Mycobacterium hackensackense]QNJ94276.1 MarR family transcriptional regulator [Mycolicibacterium fluoranthenivorans]
MSEVSESAVTAARDIRVLFGRLRRRLRDVTTADDLSPAQTAVLIRLLKNGPASASELAGAERVRPQSMATILTGLDRHGLIQRAPDPEDGRRMTVSLTAAGRTHAESDHQVRNVWLEQAMQDRFTERERQVINEALGLLDRLNEK